MNPFILLVFLVSSSVQFIRSQADSDSDDQEQSDIAETRATLKKKHYYALEIDTSIVADSAKIGNLIAGTLNGSIPIPVDSQGNITINGITKDGNTVIWPSTVGAVNTFLGITSDGQLGYSTPFGGGNVSTATNFTLAHAITTVDLPSGSDDIKQSSVTLDGSGNIVGVNNLTMTGDLAIQGQKSLQLQDGGGGGDYVAINAPIAIGTSYTLSLPIDAPTASQFLQADSTTPTHLKWGTAASLSPSSVTRMIYVSKSGNDVTGNGGLSNPYATLSKAIDIANTIASIDDPATISLNAGVYIEDNSAGPLSVTVNGVAIIGISEETTIIVPGTTSNNLLLATKNINIQNIGFDGGDSSTATGITTSGSDSKIELVSVQIENFQVGFSCAGTGTEAIFSNCEFLTSGTGLLINNVNATCYNCDVFGALDPSTTPAGTGIAVTGAAGVLLVTGGCVALCSYGVVNTNNSISKIKSLTLRQNTNAIILQSASTLLLEAASFQPSNTAATLINITATGTGTLAKIASCLFDGFALSPDTNSTAVYVADGANVILTGGQIRNYRNALVVGDVTDDTSDTVFNASSITISNCTNDIIQNGSTTLIFNAGTATGSKITINDSANVNLAYFDQASSVLRIGSLDDEDTDIIQAAIATSNNPQIDYRSSLYSTQAMGFNNPASNPSTWFTTTPDNSNMSAITTTRTKIATLNLFSDTGSPVGGTSALRGWTIQKNGSTAELAYKYQNSDIVGQSAVSEFTLMQLDGVNNQVQFPTAATQLVFDTDTNLYRSASNTLKTDDSFIAAGTITATGGFLGNLTGNVTGSASLNVLKAGDTMTGPLKVPVGLTSTPSLQVGATNVGLSSTLGGLSLSTNGTEYLAISSGGTVKLDGLAGTAGIVHNDTSGNLSSSLIVNADITNATITNAKLAAIASANTANNIVVRDSSGNFSTTMITLSGTTTNATDAATKAYVDATASIGLKPVSPVVVVSDSNIASLSGTTTIDGVSVTAGQGVLLTGQTNGVNNGIWIIQAGAWTRPTSGYFQTGLNAQGIYVFVAGGDTYADSSWVDTNATTAIIGTDPLTFALFSNPGTITAANVGAGQGTVYRDKTGDILNFRTLNQGSNVTIDTDTTLANTVTISVPGTSSNTGDTVVARNGSGNFSAGTITAALTGAASSNVLKAGDTMTGALTVKAGSVSLPSINFTGSSSNTGISAATADALSLDIAGTEIMNVGVSGVTIDAFGTAGIVHNSLAGLLSSSLIVNADITNATIANAKLATIASTNTAGNIVVRDGSGNFSAGTITASLTGNVTGTASGNLALTGGTLIGALKVPVGSAATPSLQVGATNVGLSSTSNGLSLSTNGTEYLAISSGGVVTVDNLAGAAGVVHNDISGNLTSSLIVNADISSLAAITDSKLVTISTAGKVANSATTATNANTVSAIVARDSSGNFSAGTITAALTGNVTGTASGNLPLSGGTLTGALTLPAGLTTSPTLKFTGGTNTGFSSPIANEISFDISGAEQMALNASALTVKGNVLPAATVTYNLGASGSRWATVYAANLITTNPQTGSSFLTSSGTYTTPSNITSSTRFKFTLVGGGGGGGGMGSGPSDGSSGGGAGGTGTLYTTGLAASTGYTIVVGAAGAGGTTNGTVAPTAGAATTLTIGDTTYTANGGGAATNGSAGTAGAGGSVSGFTINVSGQSGVSATPTNHVHSGSGGSSLWGLGGAGLGETGAGLSATGYGGGGGGAHGTNQNGGNGTPGMILVEWAN